MRGCHITDIAMPVVATGNSNMAMPSIPGAEPALSPVTQERGTSATRSDLAAIRSASEKAVNPSAASAASMAL